MANYRKRYPAKTKGNKCGMCQLDHMSGNRLVWVRHARPALQHQTRAQRKQQDLEREGWQDGYGRRAAPQE